MSNRKELYQSGRDENLVYEYQLNKIVDSQTNETKYEIHYSEEQDFEEVPFQHIQSYVRLIH